MALHRDIFWLGRQWAVTGHGLQLIDQRLKGAFDVDASSVWDDGLVAAMHAKDWLNRADFDKALATARARYPRSQPAAAPPPEPRAGPPIEPPPPTPNAEPAAGEPRASEMPVGASRAFPAFRLQIAASARLAPSWRIRLKPPA